MLVLHSFPTRRSSDLAPGPPPLSHPPRSASGARRARRRGPPRRRARRAPEADRVRKSTRLNSSHMSKSYAVFRLKKKLAKKIAIGDYLASAIVRRGFE